MYPADLVMPMKAELTDKGFTDLTTPAQVDEARAKLAANAQWFPKFMEGGKFAIPGSVMQRHVVKIA